MPKSSSPETSRADLDQGAGVMRGAAAVGDRHVAHVRVVGDQPGGEGLEVRQLVGRQPELRHHHSVGTTGANLGFRQDVHARTAISANPLNSIA